jgi:hypothetical protein
MFLSQSQIVFFGGYGTLYFTPMRLAFSALRSSPFPYYAAVFLPLAAVIRTRFERYLSVLAAVNRP